MECEFTKISLQFSNDFFTTFKKVPGKKPELYSSLLYYAFSPLLHPCHGI